MELLHPCEMATMQPMLLGVGEVGRTATQPMAYLRDRQHQTIKAKAVLQTTTLH